MIDKIALERRRKKIDAAKLRKKIEATARGRECGGCTACCTALAVSEVAKPANSPCQHLLQIDAPTGGGGCGIYYTRPKSCEVYECLWRAGNLHPEEYRPDRCGLIFNMLWEPGSPAERHRTAVCREVWPNAAEQEAGASLLRLLAGRTLVLLMPYGAAKPARLLGPADKVRALVAEAEAKRAEAAGEASRLAADIDELIARARAEAERCRT